MRLTLYVENRAAAWIKLSVSTLSMYLQIAPRWRAVT
jgi:hypothetical protein